MSKRIVVISDTQIPYEDRRAVKAVTNFIGTYKPDEVIHIGDLMDYPQTSRWTKGTKEEFEGKVYEHSEYAKEKFLKPLRNVYQGPIGVIEGNHDLRPRQYLAKYAPALAASREFHFDKLLDFDGFGISVLPEFYEFAPKWVATHGHLGGIRLSPIAGNTALNAARRMGVSVVMGHTHRLGNLSESRGYDGKVSQVLTGVEVGNLMNMRSAQYLKGAAANWQQGFAVIHVDGKHVDAKTVSINGGKFTVDRRTYQV